MANDSILTPGCQEKDFEETVTPVNEYLQISKNLAEFDTEGTKSAARENLDVYPKSAVYTKEATKNEINEVVSTAINNYLNQDDPHGIIPQVKEMIGDMVKTDGSTPFIAPQIGVDPLSADHLTTKKFVEKLLKDHINTEDPHQILPEVLNLLTQYVKYSDVYLKSQLYTKNEIDKTNTQFVKKDGSTAFTKAQSGVDPVIDSHLSTKRYVDNVIKTHLLDVDPHGFITILNNRLANYAKKKDVFDKTETYSRTQIDNLVIKLVNDAIKNSIEDYMDSINDKLESFRKQNFVKQDGSVPFLNTQKGIAGVEPNDLVILEQLRTAIDSNSSQLIWKTSGPVETTVGFVEDNTYVGDVLTLQEIMDAIFYGKSVSISAPDYVMTGESCDITVCIHGSLSSIDHVELWQGDQQIKIWDSVDEFKDGCVTVPSSSITEDTEFTVKVIYNNNTEYDASTTVTCAAPIFMGLLPKFKPAHYVTYDYLKNELLIPDPVNNKTFGYEDSFTINYTFKDPQFRHPFILVPQNFPYDIDSITIQSQSFKIEAIEHLTLMLPDLNDSTKTVPVEYIMYVYNESLSFANGQPVTFNFKAKNDEPQ